MPLNHPHKITLVRACWRNVKCICLPLQQNLQRKTNSSQLTVTRVTLTPEHFNCRFWVQLWISSYRQNSYRPNPAPCLAHSTVFKISYKSSAAPVDHTKSKEHLLERVFGTNQPFHLLLTDQRSSTKYCPEMRVAKRFVPHLHPSKAKFCRVNLSLVFNECFLGTRFPRAALWEHRGWPKGAEWLKQGWWPHFLIIQATC